MAVTRENMGKRERERERERRDSYRHPLGQSDFVPSAPNDTSLKDVMGYFFTYTMWSPFIGVKWHFTISVM